MSTNKLNKIPNSTSKAPKEKIPYSPSPPIIKTCVPYDIHICPDLPILFIKYI